jgi:hypothetical protein
MYTEMQLLYFLLAHVFAVNKNVLHARLFDLHFLRVWISQAGYEYICIEFASAVDWQICLVM